jgi:FkbM family methyltransferase
MIKKILSKISATNTPGKTSQKKLLSIKLKKSDIAIDCGANVGNITQFLGRSGAIVYCFEPNPYAFEVLQAKFSNTQNIHCIPKGVGDKNSKMKLYLHENSGNDEVYWSTGSSLLNFKSNVLADKYVEIDVVDLCEFIESLNHRVKILKMDVEGVECAILEKMIVSGVIDKIDHVFVETHDHKIPELAAETNHIRDLIKQMNIKNIDLNWE